MGNQWVRAKERERELAAHFESKIFPHRSFHRDFKKSFVWTTNFFVGHCHRYWVCTVRRFTYPHQLFYLKITFFINIFFQWHRIMFFFAYVKKKLLRLIWDESTCCILDRSYLTINSYSHRQIVFSSYSRHELTHCNAKCIGSDPTINLNKYVFVRYWENGTCTIFNSISYSPNLLNLSFEVFFKFLHSVEKWSFVEKAQESQ